MYSVICKRQFRVKNTHAGEFKIINIIIICCSLFFINIQATENNNEFEELARGYQNQGKNNQAAEFYNKAGYAYWNRKDKVKAAEMFQKSYDIFNSFSNHNASLLISSNIGLVYLELENYKNSYSAFNNALMHARMLKNSSEIFNALINLGSVAIELNNYSDAISKAKEALSIATELNDLKGLARSYGILAESYEKTGDDSNAYKYYDLYSTIDKKIKAQELENIKSSSEEKIRKANERKRVTEIELKIKTGELKVTQDSLIVSERLAYERKMQIEFRNAQLKEKEVELRFEKKIKTNLIIGINVVLLFLGGLGFMFHQKIKDNKILKSQKEEITQQRNKLDIQHKKITDSIQYGLRIQQAMLPGTNKLGEQLETFIFYQPKDIVSGDFYWYYTTQFKEVSYQFIAVADCTGHGVPGAFMSMIGHRLLTEIIIDKKIYDPAKILGEVDAALRKELNQQNSRSMDGMDIALCCITKIDNTYKKLLFSGAKRNIIYVSSQNMEMQIIDGDHKTIGGNTIRKNILFTNKNIDIQKGDLLYMYSDGIIDQHNYNRDRFGTNRFLEVLKKNISKPLKVQKDAMVFEFKVFKMDEEQRDDITVLGIRLI